MFCLTTTKSQHRNDYQAVTVINPAHQFRHFQKIIVKNLLTFKSMVPVYQILGEQGTLSCSCTQNTSYA